MGLRSYLVHITDNIRQKESTDAHKDKNYPSVVSVKGDRSVAHQESSVKEEAQICHDL